MRLIVIDMQERLYPHISEAESVKRGVVKLIKTFRVLDLPITVTEQERLGETIEDVRNILGELRVIKKTSFSCMGEQEFLKEVMGSKRVLLTGIEAHICVLQTAIDMKNCGFDVSVAADAIGSRNNYDKQIAIMRMVQEGIKLTTVEAAIYELIKSAKHEKFRAILDIVKS